MKRTEVSSHLKETSTYTLQSDQDSDSQSKELQKPMEELQLATSASQSVMVPSRPMEELQLATSASQSVMVPLKPMEELQL